MKLLAPLVLVLVAGCQATEIDLTIHVGADVSDAALAMATSLSYSSSGADNFMGAEPLTRPFQRTERVIYRAGAAGGVIVLALQLDDATGRAIACGVNQGISLDAHGVVAADIELAASGCFGNPGGDAGTDGGEPDLAAPDGGPDLAVPNDLSMVPFNADSGVGGPSMCPSGVLLCEGWENPPSSYPNGLWSFGGSPPYPTIDTGFAARGSQSLHMHLPASTSYQNVGAGETTMTFPNDPLYARVFVYVKTPLSGGSTTDLFAFDRQGTGMAVTVAFDQSGALELVTPGPQHVTTSANTFVPRNQWACLELEYHEASGTASLWLDGAPVSDVSQTSVSLGGHADEFLMLYDYTPNGSAPATDVWYDEIVLSTSPIGCNQ